MNFPHLSGRFSARTAFTLIELLVVITIIAILAGLLLPVGQKVLENAKKVSAKNTETQIVSAVNSYQTEYGQYPVAATTTDTTYGIDSNSANHTLFNVLRATNTADGTTGVLLNARRIVYFESKNVKNTSSARDGFIPAGVTDAKGNPNGAASLTLTTGDLMDPWGNMYLVRIDTQYTNAVWNPYNEGATASTSKSDTSDQASDPNNKDVIRTGVISWSIGNDGVQGAKGVTPAEPYSPTPGDDVDSWQ